MTRPSSNGNGMLIHNPQDVHRLRAQIAGWLAVEPNPHIADSLVAGIVNASLKLPENQRFEIVVFFALLGRILWFDPRREYSSIPTAKSRSRRAQGLSRLAASSRPPAGLGLDWPEHGGILNRIGAGGAHHIIGKFKPLVLGEIHAAGDTMKKLREPPGFSSMSAL